MSAVSQPPIGPTPIDQMDRVIALASRSRRYYGVAALRTKPDEPTVIQVCLVKPRFHGSRWELPKGGVEDRDAPPGLDASSVEASEECARRELYEETGLTVGELSRRFWVVAPQKTAKVPVLIAIYMAWCDGNQEITIGDTDEIEKCQWFDFVWVDSRVQPRVQPRRVISREHIAILRKMAGVVLKRISESILAKDLRESNSAN